MKLELPALQRELSAFRKIANLVDDRIDAAQRELEIQRKEELERAEREREHERRLRFEQRSRSIRRAVKKSTTRPSNVVQAHIRERSVYDQYGIYDHSYRTLVPVNSGQSLLTWIVSDDVGGQEVVNLTKRNRYLMVLLDNGRLGWPALNKTRLSRFGTGLETITQLESLPGAIRTGIDFTQTLSQLTDWNVRVSFWPSGTIWPPARTIRFGDNPLVQIYAEFLIDGFEFVKIEADDKSPLWDAGLEFIASEAKKQSPKLKRMLAKKLTEPFTYQSNSLGIKAASFFAGCGDCVRLTLRHREEFPVIVAESV